MHIQDFDDAEPDNTAGGTGGTMPASVPAASQPQPGSSTRSSFSGEGTT